jgi:hypothetical protein
MAGAAMALAWDTHGITTVTGVGGTHGDITTATGAGTA